MITQSEIKSQLNYCHLKGLFTWAINKPKVHIGMIAGTKQEKGYIAIKVMGNTYKAHRLAWLYVHGCMPPNQIDHINQNKSDNRIVNLRLATQSENLRNTSVRKDNSAKIKGVNLHKGRWIARCQVENKRLNLGSYDTKEQAQEAYDKYAKDNHGYFYRFKT